MPKDRRSNNDELSFPSKLSPTFDRASQNSPQEIFLKSAPEPFSNLEIDKISMQFLMGHEVSAGVQLNSSGATIKAVREERRRSRDARKLLDRLMQIRIQLEIAEALILAIEERIRQLQSTADKHQEKALELFERAETMEALIAGGLQEDQRTRAIGLLEAAGQKRDLCGMTILELEALLEAQILNDRRSATSSHQRAREAREAIKELAIELEQRKLEAIELRDRLNSATTDEHLAADLARATIQLKEDLLSLTQQSNFTQELREDVALKKQSALEPENEACNTAEELGLIDLSQFGPGPTTR